MSELFERMWEEVKDLPEFDWREVSRRGCGEDTAARYIRYWLDDGRIRVSRIGQNNKRFYSPSHLTPSVPQPVSGKATPEGNMWRAMQHLKKFTPTDIAGCANSGGIEVTVEKARAYCRQLLGSGHLRANMTAIPGRREAIYQLIEDTGPQAPRPVRLAGIEDPNTGVFIPTKGGVS